MRKNVTALPVQLPAHRPEAEPALAAGAAETTAAAAAGTGLRRRRQPPQPGLDVEFEEICGLVAARFTRHGAVDAELCRFIGLLPELKQVRDQAVLREARIVAGYLGRDDVETATAARVTTGLAHRLRPYGGVPALHVMFGVLLFLASLLAGDVVLSYLWQTSNWSLADAAGYPGFYIFNVSPWLIIAIGTAGGLGSIASVLTRLQAFNGFAGTDRRLLWMMGAMRPVIGIVFALFIFAVLQGQILPFNFPAGPQANFEYVALAFIAGFSERLSRGVIASLEHRFATQRPD